MDLTEKTVRKNTIKQTSFECKLRLCIEKRLPLCYNAFK